MGGSRIPEPLTAATTAIAVAMLALATPALAADPAAPQASGQPIVLFSTSTPAPLARAYHKTAAAAPVRRPAVPVQRIPLDGKPLIPPANLTAKPGPPPDPQPALSLETDLQPLTATPASAAMPPPGTTPPAAKSPSG